MVCCASRVAGLLWQLWPSLASRWAQPILEWSVGPSLSQEPTNGRRNQQMAWMLERLAELPRKRKADLVALTLHQALRRVDRSIRSGQPHARNRLRSQLRWLIVATTDACNLRCAGCYAKPVWGHRHLSFSRLEYVASEAERMGVETVVVTGWGEPFFDRSDKANLFRLVRAHPGLMFVVFTNGTFLTAEDLETMKSFGNLVLLLSLDGLEATNDARRGKGVFRQAAQTARQLKNSGIIFGISTTVTTANCKEVTSFEFTETVRDWGAIWVLYLRFWLDPAHGDGTWLALSSEQVSEYYSLLRAARQSQPMPLIDADESEALLGGCQARQGRLAFVDAVNGRVAGCVKLPFAPPTHNLSNDPQPGRLAELLESEWFRTFWRSYPVCWRCSGACDSLPTSNAVGYVVPAATATQSEPVERRA